MLIPTRRRTWGAQGLTPYVRYNFKHDKISALAILTVSPRRKRMGLYTQFQRENFTAIHTVDFLRQLLRHLRGHVLLLWDGAAIHKGPVVQRLLDRYPRLHVEPFPAYAPELNPTEQVWNEFKGRTANGLPWDTNELHRDLDSQARRTRRSQDKLRSFIRISDLPSPPW